MASTIASALQQMSMSLGVAAASLAAAFFILDHFEMIHGHPQFIALLGGCPLSYATILKFTEFPGM